MREWLEGLAGPEYAMAVLWTLAALAGLVILLLIVKLIRSMTFGTFVAGGRNRKTRLAVMDATAVDNHRRLVLVRRDDVEHLLLIGGPTDVVVEQDIRLSGQVRRPALTTEGGHAAPQPQRPRPAEAAPRQPDPRANAAPRPQQPPAQRPVSQVPHEPRPAPQRLPPAPQPARYTPPPPRDEIDDALMKELEVELDSPPPPRQEKRPPVSLDDEMQKLLGELSSSGRR